MSTVEIYTTRVCPYCRRAKALLEKKRVAYVEIDVSDDLALRARMVERAGGRRTVPQIFIAGQAIGGSDDLYALEQGGRLDALLAG